MSGPCEAISGRSLPAMIPKRTRLVMRGVVWYWGARVAPDFVAVGGPLDSDGDGLTDVTEERYRYRSVRSRYR